MNATETSAVPGGTSAAGRAELLPEMSLMEHLTELRARLLISVAAVVIGAIASWFFADELFRLLTRPVVELLPPDEDKLAYLSLAEPFILYVKVAALAGVFLASPIVIYQVWMFVAPGLYRHERRYALPVVGASAGCFLLGGAFGYMILFPVMANFFLQLGGEFRQVLAVSQLFGFLMRTLLGCALVFEWPVVVFFLARLGMLTAGAMWRGFGYAIVAIFVIAAVVTPTPDAPTQILLATPMLLLYLLGIGIAWLVAPSDS